MDQQKLGISPERVLILAVIVMTYFWFYTFPLKQAVDWNDVFFESLYVTIVGGSYFFVCKLGSQLLRIGWCLFLFALLLDLYDEFTSEPDFWDTTVQGVIEAGGYLVMAAGLFFAQRFLQQQMETARQARDQLVAANHDPLTRLPNRLLFRDRLDQGIAVARRDASKLVMFFIDIEQFKWVNDVYGYAFGDAVLAQIAQRLSACVRDADTVARWGGDEFLILLAGVRDDYREEFMAQKIINELNRTVVMGAITLNLTASMGIAVYPDDAGDPENLIGLADRAMYQAKQSATLTFTRAGPEEMASLL